MILTPRIRVSSGWVQAHGQERGDPLDGIPAGFAADADDVRGRPVVPPAEVGDRFERQVRPLRKMMERNLSNNYCLAAIRDALLPKLLSGDIRIEDAENFIGRTT